MAIRRTMIPGSSGLISPSLIWPGISSAGGSLTPKWTAISAALR
jgi:hypothetical protein